MSNAIPAVLPNCHQRAMEGIVGALGRRKIPIITLSDIADTSASRSRFVDKHISSPASRHEDVFLDFLLESVPRGVLFPSDDQVAKFLSVNQELLRKEGFYLHLPAESTLKEGLDKWQCHLRAEAIGISCAKTYLLDNAAHAYDIVSSNPDIYVVKATTLAGGKYIKVDSAKSAYQAFLRLESEIGKEENRPLGARLILQEWLEYSISDIWCSEALYSATGVCHGVWTVRKFRTVIRADGTFGSRLYAGRSVQDDGLADLTRTFLDKFDWRGVAHLDWVFVPRRGRFFFTELNPRFPGFSSFPSKAGFDMADFYYRQAIGAETGLYRGRQKSYFEVCRYPGDITESFGAIVRGQYSLRKLLQSYCVPLLDLSLPIIDCWDFRDMPMTIHNLKKVLRGLLGRIWQVFRSTT